MMTLQVGLCQFPSVVCPAGRRAHRERPAGAVCHGEEGLQKQEEAGKGHESAEGEAGPGRRPRESVNVLDDSDLNKFILLTFP